jgi:transposase
MTYRYGQREQGWLLPERIEDYVGPDDPVRAYDAFVDALDWSEVGIAIEPNKVGNPEYDPKTMLKLLVYGYSYGIRSSRKLERALHHNMSFMWLMGGLKPDHKTIAEFRRKHKKVLKLVLNQCARMCLELDLVSSNVLFVDGTKVRANAGRGRTHSKKRYKKQLKDMDKRIEELLGKIEAEDTAESNDPSSVSMEEELCKTEKLKARVEELVSKMEERGEDQINATDEDSAIMHSVQGSHSSYNVQQVVDDENGLIVHAEAVRDSNDLNQFACQIEAAQETLGEKCETACADAGYSDIEELGKVVGKEVHVIVPSQRQALKKEVGPFDKMFFRYDAETDCYWCPEGKELPLNWIDKERKRRYYQVRSGKICKACKHFGECTSAKKGRKIMRLEQEELKERLEAEYESEDSQKIYARRKTKVELPFGHWKRNLKLDSFSLRGLAGVCAETSLVATCFNVTRMINIFKGVEGFIQRMAKLPA